MHDVMHLHEAAAERSEWEAGAGRPVLGLRGRGLLFFALMAGACRLKKADGGERASELLASSTGGSLMTSLLLSLRSIGHLNVWDCMKCQTFAKGDTAFLRIAFFMTQLVIVTWSCLPVLVRHMETHKLPSFCSWLSVETFHAGFPLSQAHCSVRSALMRCWFCTLDFSIQCLAYILLCVGGQAVTHCSCHMLHSI